MAILDGMRIAKIISGGQTGVDRGALDAAIAAKVPHGGYCPRGRIAEDGEIPMRYRLSELASRHYSKRTAANVDAADGTLILTYNRVLSSGTRLTHRLAVVSGKPLLAIILALDATSLVDEVVRWVNEHNIRVLNVAGPRESQVVGIQREVEEFIGRVIARLRASPKRPRATKRKA